ncbi:MAG: hypothetical protein UIC45_05995 [Paludibacteraceae bacterium]|nr:hypothetical protein [Paludibacteraceae bacterium]
MSTANTNISEIRAEVLLNHLYPEKTESWIARDKGAFYRNYSDDILHLEEKKNQISLSRDGFLKLLPQGMISAEDELRGKDFPGKYEALSLRKKLLEELFVPFDSWHLRDSIHNEEDLAELLENKLNVILKTFYGVEIDEEQNPYVKEMMKLLPQASHIRGNFHKIGDLLNVILKHKVTTHISCYNWSDKSMDTQPMITYKVWIPKLTNEEYSNLQKSIEQLVGFISQWFIPFDTRCVIELKTNQRASLNSEMLLNYNTRLSL